MDGLCLFLATALKFAILRDTLIRGTPNLSPRVAFAIKEFKKDKKESEFLKALVCDMFAELEKQKIRVGDKFALDPINHTNYTDDDFVELMRFTGLLVCQRCNLAQEKPRTEFYGDTP